MDILIKSARIIDVKSSHHQKVTDVLISNGKIQKIADNIKHEGQKLIEAEDLYLSIGWLDLHANLQDPGYEHKEDIQSGLAAAAAGGFSRIAVSPLSNPVRDSKAQIEYLTKTAAGNAVTVLPYGSISVAAAGEELAELYDQRNSGALAFFDGKNSVANPNLLNRALEYTKSFDGLVVNFPNTKELAAEGVMNEGRMSTSLGLKGIPEIAESTMVSRDLSLLEYAEGRLHFNTISTPKSVELIQHAQQNGLKVSCDVASYSLLLSDEQLSEFDSRFKTMPPLRDKAAIDALIAGIKNGTIQAICSDHQPEDIESKKVELDHAAFGIINLQTAFSTANTALKNEVSIERIVELFTDGPIEILKVERNAIEEGEEANITLFQPNESFEFNVDQVVSKSKNSPFFKQKLSGKVIGIINNNQLIIND